MRKLASIRQISDIQPIEGKDKIVLATIDGWHVIVKKDEFAVGDLCVYVEIDSVMPEKPEFEFLRKKDFRISTMKMAGVVSEGICFPVDFLPNGHYEFGQDVTELMGVKQYEPTMDVGTPAEKESKPEPRYPKWLMRFAWFRKLVLRGKTLNRDFPSLVSKSDEQRIQNIPQVLNNRDKQWIPTEKIDGCSATYLLVRKKRKFPFKDKFVFYVCSRNYRIPVEDDSQYWKIARKYDIEWVLRQLINGREWVCFQGEIVGPKIQKNKYHLLDHDFYLYNFIDEHGRYSSVIGEAVAHKFEMKWVPLFDSTTLPETVDEVLKMAHGNSVINPDVLREGLVFRSIDGKDSFKAVDPEFLIKYNE